MFKEPEINDPSLLRCVVKKSAQVVKKCAIVVTVLAAIVVTVLAAITIVGYGVYLLLPVFITIAGMIVSAIISIPWYYYVGAVAIAVIPVYSFLWCIARDLTDEDWGSEAANNAAIAFAVALAFAVAVAVAFAVDPVDKITIWYYIFRFVGAVWHHYKQKRNRG